VFVTGKEFLDKLDKYKLLKEIHAPHGQLYCSLTDSQRVGWNRYVSPEYVKEFSNK
jgi:hypothetical protein